MAQVRNRSVWLISLSLAWLVPGFCTYAESPRGPVAWDPTVFRAPKTHEAPGFEAEAVKAVFYDGLPVGQKPNRVFAWYGLPKIEAGKKVPGIVLVHGGGGTAFDEWVRLWTGRGYAAIAMDTCGQIPRGSYGHWQRDEQGGPPGWGGFEQIDQPLTEQWPYQAVADVILAHSLLRSMPEVDPDRIGLTGISWGGYLTCIVAGVDHRFRFAVPVYGCGFLGENSAWLGQFEKMGPEKSRRWLSLWDPSVYLKQAALAMFWVDGTNDFAYPLDSLEKSYRLPRGPRELCVRIRMPHGQGAGEKPQEIQAFADAVVSGTAPLPRITSQGRDDRRVWITYESVVPVVAAELNFTTDQGEWQKRRWDSITAVVNGEQKKASALLPEGVKVYYLNLIDKRGLCVSSEHEEFR